MTESSDEEDHSQATERTGKMFHAAARRMAGFCVVLDASVTDRGTRAAILHLLSLLAFSTLTRSTQTA